MSFLSHWHLFGFDCFEANKNWLKTFGSAQTLHPPFLMKKKTVLFFCFFYSFLSDTVTLLGAFFGHQSLEPSYQSQFERSQTKFLLTRLVESRLAQTRQDMEGYYNKILLIVALYIGNIYIIYIIYIGNDTYCTSQSQYRKYFSFLTSPCQPWHWSTLWDSPWAANTVLQEVEVMMEVLKCRNISIWWGKKGRFK